MLRMGKGHLSIGNILKRIVTCRVFLFKILQPMLITFRKLYGQLRFPVHPSPSTNNYENLTGKLAYLCIPWFINPTPSHRPSFIKKNRRSFYYFNWYKGGWGKFRYSWIFHCLCFIFRAHSFSKQFSTDTELGLPYTLQKNIWRPIRKEMLHPNSTVEPIRNLKIVKLFPHAFPWLSSAASSTTPTKRRRKTFLYTVVWLSYHIIFKYISTIKAISACLKGTVQRDGSGRK